MIGLGLIFYSQKFTLNGCRDNNLTKILDYNDNGGDLQGQKSRL